LRVVHELVDDAALLPGSPAVRCDGIEGRKSRCRAVEGFFGDGSAAVVDEVGRDACRFFPLVPDALEQPMAGDCSAREKL